jgi:hypothetical protein
VRSLGDCPRYALPMPSGENFSRTPQRCPVVRSGQPVPRRKVVCLVSAVFEGLLPTQADRMSDGFHTRFDGSPLFCRRDLTVALKAPPPRTTIIPQQSAPSNALVSRWL